MRVSKFIKANKFVLLEYIYDTENNISDSYEILINLKDNILNLSYMSGGIGGDTSFTNNGATSQLFKLDPINNIYGLINTTDYSFLQIKDYNQGFPARHDSIRIHFPTNYTFGEYIGFYIRVYTLDYNNNKGYDLSNFYFDSTDSTQTNILGFTSPPLLFNETLWGKNILLNFPSISYLANQRKDGSTAPNTINYNLTNGAGLSQNAPVFIDFHFIRSKKTLNSVTTYTLGPKTAVSFPQSPDYEKLGLIIQHSQNGDFFEIFGSYNGNITEFNTFMNNSVLQGKRYYIEYEITLFEQNIRGKTFKIIVDEDFNEKIEYRPIIKFSTTTAIIEVVMNLIDAVDMSTIQRRASYGMLQDEVAKYSLNLTKINLQTASKPKIYNIKNPEGAGIFGNLNGSAYSDGRLYGNAGGSLFSTNTSKNLFGLGRKGRGSNIGTAGGAGGSGLSQISDQSRPQVIIEPYPVDRLVLSDRFSILTKTDSVAVGGKLFYGLGKVQIILYTFDNIIQFFMARDVTTSATQTTSAPEYLDLTNVGEIKMVIKNQQTSLDFPLYTESQAIDLSIGQIVFRIAADKMGDVRKIFDSGVNIFYVTTTNNSIQTVIYSGLFTIFDSKENINNLNNQQAEVQAAALGGEPAIVSEVEPTKVGTALVTRRIVAGGAPGGTTTGANAGGANGGANTDNLTNSSIPSTIKEDDWTYEVTSRSSVVVDGYEYTNSQLKQILLGTPNESTNLTGLVIKSTTSGISLLAKDNKFLGQMREIRNSLYNSLNETNKTQARQTSESFRISERNKQTSGTASSVGLGLENGIQSTGKITETTFNGSIYKITPGINVGGKPSTNIILKYQGVQNFTIYTAQLEKIYPSVTDWTNMEFKNNSQLFANGVYVDNLNTLTSKWLAGGFQV